MDKVTYISSSIALLDWCSLISIKVGEGRPGERRGKGKEREKKIKKDKVKKNTDFLKEDLGPLNWSCRGPISILAFEILFKSTAVSKDWRM